MIERVYYTIIKWCHWASDVSILYSDVHIYPGIHSIHPAMNTSLGFKGYFMPPSLIKVRMHMGSNFRDTCGWNKHEEGERIAPYLVGALWQGWLVPLGLAPRGCSSCHSCFSHKSTLDIHILHLTYICYILILHIYRYIYCSTHPMHAFSSKIEWRGWTCHAMQKKC